MATYPLPDHPQLIKLADWKALGTRLFGPDKLTWKFSCLECGHVSTIADHLAAWGGGLQSPMLGRKCPKCNHSVAPPSTYGKETCFRVFWESADLPCPEEAPTGAFGYVMPFWVPDAPKTAAEAVIGDVIESVGEPGAHEPKPAPKKGAPVGYGFKF